jgi:uridine kinase
MDESHSAAARIAADLQRVTVARPLAAISGVDGSGKSTVADEVAARLTAAGRRVALVRLDDWRTPASVRFVADDPAQHFLDNAYRFDDLFALLVGPLVRTGRVDLVVDSYPSGADEPVQLTLRHDQVDLVVVEGIFLLKRGVRERFDRTYWIDCAAEVALARALARNQEGRPVDELRHDYQTIYQPAQRLHLERDEPLDHADLIVHV